MVFRYARHTISIERIKDFYTRVLNFEVLGKFRAHNKYNGIFLGQENSGWHLEFTESDAAADHKFDEDDILVFYPSSIAEYGELVRRIEENKLELLTPKNPYWRTNGIMIMDPDGYRIVISPLKCRHQQE